MTLQPRFYAGIGSRSTPDSILRLMHDVAAKLAAEGWILRSGGAEGADTAFAEGAGDAAQIFLPWAGFNGVQVNTTFGPFVQDDPAAWTFGVAKKYHPAWDKLRQGGQKLQARNCHQVFGVLPPLDATRASWAKFVLCWTPGGSGSGGTGQAIRIAKAYGIPVFDMGEPSVARRVMEWV